jgi:hypothetical protein
VTRCGRCNSCQSRPVAHSRHARLCDYCRELLGASTVDYVRAGVDFHLAADPRGAVVAQIVGILREARV